MTDMRLAERLIEAIDWSSFRSIQGDGTRVRRALEELLAAEVPETAQEVYWDIENVAFAQGELFEVAEACASVLIASLADPRPDWVRVLVLELLFQIVSGYASQRADVPIDLLQRCREAVRKGIWLLHREALAEREGALDVLDGSGNRRWWQC